MVVEQSLKVEHHEGLTIKLVLRSEFLDYLNPFTLKYAPSIFSFKDPICLPYTKGAGHLGT